MSNEIREATKNEIELQPEMVEEEKEGFTKKIPLDQIASFGIAFEPLSQAFHYVTSDGAGSGLYKVVVPKGQHLASFKDGSGYLGMAFDSGNHLASQARLNPVVCNPAMIFMAVSVASIEKKLDDIQETQIEIQKYLVGKDKAKQRGDIEVLKSIINDYKFNCDNKKYKDAQYVKVLDIRQSAEHSILFYEDRISEKISAGVNKWSKVDIEKKLGKIRNEFKEYQLAQYIFAFSTFLAALLLENYDSDYLRNEAKKIEDRSYKYRILYTKAYNLIRGSSNETIESKLLEGAAFVTHGLGKLVEKVPQVNKTSIDEFLIETGEEIGEKRVHDNEKLMRKLKKHSDTLTVPFMESIEMLEKVYGGNEPMELFFDNENLYLPE